MVKSLGIFSQVKLIWINFVKYFQTMVNMATKVYIINMHQRY